MSESKKENLFAKLAGQQTRALFMRSLLLLSS